MPWYVVHTKPKQELLAATLLEERLNLDTYYPEVVIHRRGQHRRTAFFPNYLFVAADLRSIALSTIDSTPGVVRVVRFQADPRALPDEFVANLRERIETVNAGGGLPTHAFRIGDSVRITAGPMQGLEGLFAGPLTATERVTVLLRFLGNERPVSVSLDLLEPNANPTPPPSSNRPRRTRGRGRPIYPQQHGSSGASQPAQRP